MELEAAPPATIRQLSIDDVFRAIGEFGTYQRWHYAKVVSTQLCIAVCTLGMVFTNRPPLWRNLADPTPGSGDLTAVVRLSEVPCDGEVSWAYVAPWQSVRSEWGLVCEHEWVSRLLDALYFVGFGFGATFFGKVSDARGRKRAHAVSLSLAAIAMLLSASAPGVTSYAVFRCVCGVGVGGVNVVAYVWACEPIGQAWQSRAGMLSAIIFAVAAGVVLPLLSLLLPGWRGLTVASAAICVPHVLWLALTADESPRWLLGAGQLDAARAVLWQVARVNGAISDAEMTDLNAEMARASGGGATAGEDPPTAPPTEPHTEPGPPRAEAPSARGRCPLVTPSAPSGDLRPRALSPRAPSVHQLLEQLSAAPTSRDTSKGDGAAAAAAAPALGSDLFEGQLQGRTMASMYVWLAVSLVYYGLSLSAGHMGGGGSLHANFALSMGIEVPGKLFSGFLLDRIGRRTTLLCGLLVGSCACLACALLSSSLALRCALVGKFAIGGAFALLFVYTAEMFPTTHRGVALGLCSTSARFGGVAAPAVLHIGHIHPAWPWVLLSAVSFLASAWAAMELPETRGAPLPETLEDCHVPHKAKIRQAE